MTKKRELAAIAEAIEGCASEVRRPFGCQFWERRHFLACIAECGLASCIAVLHVGERILARMLYHRSEIEIEHGIVPAIKHVETNGVTPDFIHDLAQCDELACPLRHYHRLTGPQ